MINDNLYIESYVKSVPKRNNNVCGDYTIINRSHDSTDFVLADGMGSGIKANISAIACASRLIELITNDIPLFRAAEKVVELMKRAKTENIPFSTFTIVRILPNGQFTIINYENPMPVLINNGIVQTLKLKHKTIAEEIVSEFNGNLYNGDSLILFSDGVHQAGLGLISGLGWGAKGVESFIKRNLRRTPNLKVIADNVVEETYKLSNFAYADDTTVATLSTRPAKILNLISGPPISRNSDIRFALSFLESKGKQVICGSSTSDMVARVSGKKLKDVVLSSSFTQPPKYHMEGIELVTEGAITLNQVYNILDEDSDTYDQNSCVSDLAILLKEADVINVFMGMASNIGHSDISFKQMGVMERRKILPLICEKLQSMGKLVKIQKK